MGIIAATFTYMARIVPTLGPMKSVLTLGIQDVFFTPQRALEIAADFGLASKQEEGRFELKSGHPFVQSFEAGRVTVDRPSQGMISDVALFNLLGFEEIKSTDVSRCENVDYFLDLNHRTAASAVGREFDMVFDGGTMEHVFHIPNALCNIFDCLKIGGCVLHENPSNNTVDHGFYQISPTLLYDYYVANRFEIVDCQFVQGSPDQSAPHKYLKYVPGVLDSISFGGLDNKMYGVTLIARKTPASTCGVVPQQSYYNRRREWREGLVGNPFNREDELRESETACRRLLERDPDNAQALYRLGLVEIQRGRPLEAVQLLQAAVRNSPLAPEMHCDLGSVAKIAGDLPLAIASYRHAIQLNPQLAEAHNNLGVVLRQIGDPAGAESSYRRALEIRPDFGDAQANLLNLLATQKRPLQWDSVPGKS